MELIPILYTFLLVSLGLLVVVLIYSVKSSHKEKQVVQENYKELVNQRKIAYSKEQSEYIKRMNGGFEAVNDEQERAEEMDSQSVSNSSQEKPEASKEINIEDSYFIPGKTRGSGRRRFAVLNESVSVPNKSSSALKSQSVFPVNVNNSGNYYG